MGKHCHQSGAPKENETGTTHRNQNGPPPPYKLKSPKYKHRRVKSQSQGWPVTAALAAYTSGTGKAKVIPRLLDHRVCRPVFPPSDKDKRSQEDRAEE